MKLERNRAERRNRKGTQICFAGIPFLVFAALAAGFLSGAPQIAAISAIKQADKSTVIKFERKAFIPALSGYIGKTNSVISRTFSEDDFTYSGSHIWWNDEDGNWKLKFLTSGTFYPRKRITIDIFIVGGGSGGRTAGPVNGGGGGAGGRTGTWRSVVLPANTTTGYAVVVGAGGAKNLPGESSSFNANYSANGGANNNDYRKGGNGGSGGGGADGGNGGSNGSNGVTKNYAGGTGQGTADNGTREFGEATGTLYAGGGGAGGGQYSYNPGGVGGAGGGANGGAGAGNNGGSAAANTGGGGGGGGSDDDSSVGSGGSGGSGIVIIRNMR